jgi:hypothetical protein
MKENLLERSSFLFLVVGIAFKWLLSILVTLVKITVAMRLDNHPLLAELGHSIAADHAAGLRRPAGAKKEPSTASLASKRRHVFTGAAAAELAHELR